MRVDRTDELEPAELRELLEAAFDDLEESDVAHCFGGVHVVVREAGALVGHAAVVGRELRHGGRALRCGYVEGVAVRPDRRRRGIGTALMAEVGAIVRERYEMGALGTTDAARRLYEAAGWRRWRGATVPADDSVYVLETGSVALDLDGALAADERDGDLW